MDARRGRGQVVVSPTPSPVGFERRLRVAGLLTRTRPFPRASVALSFRLSRRVRRHGARIVDPLRTRAVALGSEARVLSRVGDAGLLGRTAGRGRALAEVAACAGGDRVGGVGERRDDRSQDRRWGNVAPPGHQLVSVRVHAHRQRLLAQAGAGRGRFAVLSCTVAGTFERHVEPFEHPGVP